MDSIAKAAKLIREASNIVVLTGAGASTESGIPDFRSPKKAGVRQKNYGYPAEVLLSHSFFISHTDIFYDYYRNNLLYPEAKPNDCHLAIAGMEGLCSLRAVITQNIDGLHQEAGSTGVIELHGTTRRNYCMKCRKQYSLGDIAESEQMIPKCKNCGGIIKPDVVLYEEPLNERDLSRAVSLSANADVMLVVGTSLVVYPAAGLLDYYMGNKLIIININPTPYDKRASVLIHEKAGPALKKIVSMLKDE